MIELQRDGHIFTLILSSGENRFDTAFLHAFDSKLDEVIAAAGDGPAGLVVTSLGKYWSNGIDLEYLAQAPKEERDAYLPTLNRLFGRLVSFPLPTVAALNGHTFAGGAILALAFDYRVMRTERGWFCLPEVDIQIPFAPPMLSLLKAKLRTDTLRDAVLGGTRYTGEQALAAGIADRACDLGRLQQEATELLAPLALKARPTYSKFKRDLYGELSREFGCSP